MANKSFVIKNGLKVANNLIFANNGAVGVNTASPSVTVHINSTDAIFLPKGTTAQRPTGANGMIRYNTNTDSFEGFSNGDWAALAGVSSAPGGNTQIIFNDSGYSNSVSGLVFNKSANNLTVANTVLVGANVSLSTVAALIGNSTVNASMNNVQLSFSGNSIINSTTFSVGNSTVNAVINSTALSLSGNVWSKASAANYQANDADKILTTTIVWSAASQVTLTDGATVTPDFGAGINFVLTLGGNRTIANPTNIKAGQAGMLLLKQDGTGSRTASWGSYWKWAAGTPPTLTTTASRTDKITYYCESATIIHASCEKDSR